jgi:pyridoxine/pyridoxamine 5'-phosphate oxidase
MTEIWQPKAAEAARFMNDFPLCVLSTGNSAGWPIGSTVAFSARDDLELMFGTSRDSRKFANIELNPQVSVTVTDENRRLTVQYQGLARQLSAKEYAARREAHYAKLPQSLPFEGSPGQAFFTITPVAVRMTDCNPTPWVVTELLFDQT